MSERNTARSGGCFRTIGIVAMIIAAIFVLAIFTGQEAGRPRAISTPSAGAVKPVGRAVAAPDPNVTARRAPAADLLDVQLYGGRVGGIIRDMAAALGLIEQLMLSPQLGDNNWTIRVAAQFAVIRVAHERMEALEPPAGMSEIHALYVAATQKCSDATYKAAYGIDRLDAGLLGEATRLIEACGREMLTAVDRFAAHVKQ